MRKNIILCGVGGQGTVLASRLISAAAMAKGIPVLSAETIGMAQRGGSVFSHIRLGEGIYSPMIARGEADLIIGFEPGEAVRLLPFLKPGGSMIVSDRAVMPVTASLTGTDYRASDMLDFLSARVPDLRIVPAEQAMQSVGSPKVLNLILLGAALSTGALGLAEADLKEAIRARIPEKFHELNFKALAWAKQYQRK
jgi:indolepyruvate ferredoxin oxidoreductase beta subunit